MKWPGKSKPAAAGLGMDESRAAAKDSVVPDQGLVDAASRTPGGWVYEIDDAYADSDEVPPSAILRAWEVDVHGRLTGRSMDNPRYASGGSGGAGR